jgi:hypothetical protein
MLYKLNFTSYLPPPTLSLWYKVNLLRIRQPAGVKPLKLKSLLFSMTEKRLLLIIAANLHFYGPEHNFFDKQMMVKFDTLSSG